MTEQEQRAAVVAEAKTWLRTPFRDMARIKGVGVDCGQLLVAVLPVALGIDLYDPGHYSIQHHLNASTEEYVEHVLKCCREISEDEADAGDIVVYKSGRTYSHGAFLVDKWPGTIIHAMKPFGVIYSDVKRDGFLKKRARRFFSVWGEKPTSAQK
jgi:cell wall-associated NlpC family hydrolase